MVNPISYHRDSTAINGCRQILKKRTSLTEQDRQYLEDHLDNAIKAVSSEFTEREEATYKLICTMVDRLNLQQGYEWLTRVQPALSPIIMPEQAAQGISQLSGDEGVAFDLARNVETTLSYLQSMWPLWRAWWQKNAIQQSNEAWKSEMLLCPMVEDLVRREASLQAFMTFYRLTMQRVTSVYTSLSRVIAVATASQWALPQTDTFSPSGARPQLPDNPEDEEILA